MKKKLLSVLLCAAMAATMMTGCGTKEEPAAAPAEETSAPEADTSAAPADTTGSDEGSAEGKAYNIGYSNMQLKEDFFITVEGGIHKAAEDAGYVYNTTISDRDATKMKQNIEALVTKGADIIIDFNVMAEAGSAIASDLAKENIPMLSVDCIYDGAYFFGVNNLEAGEILGQTAAEYVDSKFGGELEYIVNVYDAASGDEIKKRNDGVVNVLQEKYGVPDDNVVWLDSKQDDVKSQTMTKDWLNSHPDATKIVIVGQNDDRGYAANAAVEGESRKDDCIVVSHNADPAPIENLQKHVEDKDTAWVATASYNSHLYGEQIMDMATKILNGEEVEQNGYTKVTIVTLDNVNEYVKDRDAAIAAMQ
ncbi:sugar ABC transporter substrate-binding protein [Diplocloster agilis]|uniref:Sugar ABC transporter substrate-binding protein n=1 Tax=Diplocloster agilis TaxID=2850323 RepID=A0A949JUK1_9FIRM|nr:MULTISPECIES: sugar ABC transporter substrate-binding protein [Lachnospiraceae]MBU9735398.1 sugar ABC transporter substrate-binding protein [Diplocloster agilis]MBU9742250.1 sugar ABC transporter substrate-binding protein [Diplocloster agilis]MCU6734405.1 sugar ABC transporter substrate-binding protein [Suonthocola fibrivorans]SCJ37938.1 D-ribose-binding periplasmic protein precursor [uncultured Clostridium sp.]